MSKISEFLAGKKTYIVAVALVIYAIAGVYSGQLSQDAAVTLFLNSLGLGSLRSAIGTK